MKNNVARAFVITMQVEDPQRGTLEVTHAQDMDDLNTYSGPLGRIILHDPAGPEAQFYMPSAEFIIFLAQFLQKFREVE